MYGNIEIVCHQQELHAGHQLYILSSLWLKWYSFGELSSWGLLAGAGDHSKIIALPRLSWWSASLVSSADRWADWLSYCLEHHDYHAPRKLLTVWLRVVPQCNRGLTELVAHLNQPLNRPWVQLTTSWALSIGWSNHVQAHCSGYQLLLHSCSHLLLDQMASGLFPAADQDLLNSLPKTRSSWRHPSVSHCFAVVTFGMAGCPAPELERERPSLWFVQHVHGRSRWTHLKVRPVIITVSNLCRLGSALSVYSISTFEQVPFASTLCALYGILPARPRGQTGSC